MIAAVYARKSTDQSGISDEQKSVARQIDHARQYALKKGWTVADEHPTKIATPRNAQEFSNSPCTGTSHTRRVTIWDLSTHLSRFGYLASLGTSPRGCFF
jgi:hypothetical protein